MMPLPGVEGAAPPRSRPEKELRHMGTEIERKFLTRGVGWRQGGGVYCRQGYLCRDPERTVRVRVMGGKGFLTIKGKSAGAAREEHEYEIPLTEAEAILDSLTIRPLIEKRRYIIPHDGLIWEVDEFFGDNAGLVIAELELEREDQPFAKPGWAGEEVTRDPRYYNASLVDYPFKAWK